INGTTVNTWFGAARAIDTDGIYGIRVNHFLEVEADRFAAAPLATATASSAETVAITGPVREVLSHTAFIIRSPNGQDSKVVAPELQRDVEANAIVTVFGGRKSSDTLLATSVLTADMVDLTQRVPPPATAEEEALDGIMKRVGPAFTAVRAAIDGS